MGCGPNPLVKIATGLIIGNCVGAAAFAQAGSLVLASATAAQGGSVTIGLSITSAAGSRPAGLQWTLLYSPSDIASLTVTPGPAATAGGKSITCAGGAGSQLCLLTGLNSSLITDGVVANVSLTLSPTMLTSTSISLAGVMGASAAATALPITATGATVTVLTPLAVSSVTCSPGSLVTPSNSNCTLTLNQAAPANTGVALSSNNANLAVPSSVQVPAGAATAGFTVAAASVSGTQTAVVTVALGGSSQTTSITLLAPLAVAALGCNPSTFNSGGSTTCTVALNQAAPSSTIVAVSDDNFLVVVPPSVTIATGAASAQFAVNTAPMSATQNVAITAALGGSSQTASLTLLPPLALSSLQCVPATLTSGEAASCTVALNQAAPSSTVVTLSDNSALLTVPVSVTIPGGQSSATFAATAGTIGSPQAAVVTAAWNGVSQTVSISLEPPTAVTSLQCNPNALVSAGVATCTVALNQAASAGAIVAIKSSNSLLTTPASVTVASGSATADFSVTAGTIANGQTATITATLGASSQTFAVSLLTPLVPVSVKCKPSNLNPGGGGTCTVGMNRIAYLNQVVTLSSSNLTALAVPASITIQAQSSNGTFPVTAGNLSGQFTVTAAFGGVSQWAKINISGKNLPATSAVSGLDCAPQALFGSATSTCTVRLAKPAPSGGMTVSLASDAALQMPSVVQIPAGSASAQFPARGWISDSEQAADILAATPGGIMTTRIQVMGLQPLAVSCLPKTVAAGSPFTCEVRLNSAQIPDTILLDAESSSADVHVPVYLATRAMQSSLSFRSYTNPAAGPQAVTVRVSFGIHAAQDSVTIAPASGPVLSVPARQFARPGEVVSFQVSAANPSGGPVSLSASKLPAGASFDPASGAFEWIPARQAGSYIATFAAVNSLGAAVSRSVAIEVGSGAPAVTSVVNGASRAAALPCSPGSVASISGEWLVEDRSTWSDQTGQAAALGGTRVTVNGNAVPLLFASNTRVDFLCPATAPGSALHIGLQTALGASRTVTVPMSEGSPGIFSLDGTGQGQGMIQFPGTGAAAVVRNPLQWGEPAQPGDNLALRVTGLPANLPVAVEIGGIQAAVQSFNPASGAPGAYDVVITVPQGAPFGDAIPVQIEYAGDGGHVMKSNVVTIALEPVQP